MMYLGDKAVGVNTPQNAAPSYSLNLTYGQGLNRTYDYYTTSTNRARTTEDILISTGEGIEIIINNSDYQVAVGAWSKENYDNILYGGWDANLLFYPPQDVLIKLVFRNKNDQPLTSNEIPENAIIIKVLKSMPMYKLHT